MMIQSKIAGARRGAAHPSPRHGSVVGSSCSGGGLSEAPTAARLIQPGGQSTHAMPLFCSTDPLHKPLSQAGARAARACSAAGGNVARGGGASARELLRPGGLLPSPAGARTPSPIAPEHSRSQLSLCLSLANREPSPPINGLRRRRADHLPGGAEEALE